jgi:hypothetical protein
LVCRYRHFGKHFVSVSRFLREELNNHFHSFQSFFYAEDYGNNFLRNSGTSISNCGTLKLNFHMNYFRRQQPQCICALETHISQTLLEWSNDENGHGNMKSDRSTVRESVFFLALLVTKRLHTLDKIIVCLKYEREKGLCFVPVIRLLLFT